jgi:hypothetical protein
MGSYRELRLIRYDAVLARSCNELFEGRVESLVTSAARRRVPHNAQSPPK